MTQSQTANHTVHALCYSFIENPENIKLPVFYHIYSMKLINAPTSDSSVELIARLWRKDYTLWSRDSKHKELIQNRLGWIDAASFMAQHNEQITAFARNIVTQAYQHVVVLGMGGSSLAPEVYSKAFAPKPRYPRITVLDSTSPRRVREVATLCETTKSLFIVSSKSGTTAETEALCSYFFEWCGSRGFNAADHFVAITDTDSALHKHALNQNFKSIFLNPDNIGGRYSALSYFGLVPAALLGIDLNRILTHVPNGSDHPALVKRAAPLGFALAELAKQGKNKLTLVFNQTLAPLAPWIEQLIDESTGKQEQGIVVIADEPLGVITSYSDDRFFVFVDTEEQRFDSKILDSFINSEYPIAYWTLKDTYHLGQEYFVWQVATAIAGSLMGINPFDEPDVNDSKASTRALLVSDKPGKLTTVGESIQLNTFLKQARGNDYLTVLAFLAPQEETERLLKQWRASLNKSTGLPCCFAFGPRYLHSSGQLHKGGPNQGLFIVITQDDEENLPIPGQTHGFRELINAQAAGDIEVLKKRRRRVWQYQIKNDDDGLQQLLQMDLN